jgi:hypothetical protein
MPTRCPPTLAVRCPGEVTEATHRAGQAPGANLRGADLSPGMPVEVDLDHATADRHTVWPSGFDWRSAGGTVVEWWPRPHGYGRFRGGSDG